MKEETTMTETKAIPRLLLAAPHSGSGKTTVTCALLRLLQQRQRKVAAFKNGPDYIDTLFHTRVVHTPSRNLDLFLLGRGHEGAERARYLLARNSRHADIAVIEGAMGYYDGVGTMTEASAYDLAVATNTPVIVVVDGRGAGISLSATILGMKSLRKNHHIVGFIVNQVRPMTYTYFKDVWEKEAGLPALGYMPPMADCAFSSRHLGLFTPMEIADIQEKIDKLARQAEVSLDIERILALAEEAAPLAYTEPVIPYVGPVRLAVAKDEAFCFYYEDNVQLFRDMGAEIVFFSPIHDDTLPPCDGIYLGGGYPEVYATALASNTSMRDAIREALQRGCPCIAECGGFMYLQQAMEDTEGRRHEGVGILQGTSHMTKHLVRFGYVMLRAEETTMLFKKGDTIPAHEFHYTDSTENGTACIAQKAAGNRSWPCVQHYKQTVAGYPHMHFVGNPTIAARFLGACMSYRREGNHEN